MVNGEKKMVRKKKVEWVSKKWYEHNTHNNTVRHVLVHVTTHKNTQYHMYT